MFFMPAQTESHQLISTEVQEIISYRPHWIIRRGNLFFFLILIGILFGSWLIKYPDMVKGSLRISAVDGPKSVVAKTEGNIIRLLVKNEAEVKEGEPLAYMQSTGAHNEVLQLKNWIHQVEQPVSNESIELLLNYPFPALNNLGELQPDYEIFRLQLKETMQILQSGYYVQKKRALLRDITYQEQLKNNLAKQNELLKKEYDVQNVDYNAKEGLAKENVIAPLELNQEKGRMLIKEQGLEQMAAQLINGNIASHNKQKELLELQKYVMDQRLKFQSVLFSLKSKTYDWLLRFIVTAPQSGKLFYTSFITENQLVSAGSELFYVQPGKSNYFGLLTAGQNGIGKIATGQDVIIRVQGYPSEQFGYLKGKVTYISNLPNRNDSFLIRVDLPKDLITNQQYKLQFRNNLLATAEVVTKERRLLERFTGKMYEMMSR
jgi:multidrug resistance efflux pump